VEKIKDAVAVLIMVAVIATCSWAFAAEPKAVPVPKSFCIAFTGLGDRMQIELAGDKAIKTPVGTITRYKVSGYGFIGFDIFMSGAGGDLPDRDRLDAGFDGNFGGDTFNNTVHGSFELLFTPGAKNTGTGMIFYDYPNLGIRNRSSVTQIPCGEAFNDAVNASKAVRALGVERFSTDQD
jgi:hypothetical protein